MIDRIIRFSIQHKAIIGLFTLALVLFGAYSLTQLPIDAVPDITNNQVQVITTTPTLAAQEVEQFVTAPIERAMASLPDRVEIRSISRFGLSLITIVFEEDVDIYFARTLVDQRLGEAADLIPPGVGKPTMAPVSTGLGEVYQYVIHPKSGYEGKFSPSELRTIQEWIVVRQLLGIPGVAEVNSYGGEMKQYEVSVDAKRLQSMGVTIGELFTALENNNENSGGAYIEKRPNSYSIRSEGLLRSLDDIRKVVVKTPAGGVPLLRLVVVKHLAVAQHIAHVAHQSKGVGQQDHGAAPRSQDARQFTRALRRLVIMLQAADGQNNVGARIGKGNRLPVADHPACALRLCRRRLNPVKREIETKRSDAAARRQFQQPAIAAGHINQQFTGLRLRQFQQPQIKRIAHKQLALPVKSIVGRAHCARAKHGLMANLNHGSLSSACLSRAFAQSSRAAGRA